MLSCKMTNQSARTTEVRAASLPLLSFTLCPGSDRFGHVKKFVVFDFEFYVSRYRFRTLTKDLGSDAQNATSKSVEGD